jgi:hypothetical protein
VKNGSIISGIFHATNSDKDFGTRFFLSFAAFKNPFQLYMNCVVIFLQCLASASPTGVVLKMAQVIKDGARGQRYATDVVKKPETMIIPARELVQVFAKVSFFHLHLCYIIWFANFHFVIPSLNSSFLWVPLMSLLVELTRCHELCSNYLLSIIRM